MHLLTSSQSISFIAQIAGERKDEHDEAQKESGATVDHSELASSEDTSTLTSLSLWPPTLSAIDEFVMSAGPSVSLPPTSISASSLSLISATASSSPAAAAGGLAKNVRCFFHPHKEVPLLRDWFKSNQKPSDYILNRYADILNQGSVRQER